MEVLQRTANRGSVSTGYDIDNSLKIEADSAERMQRTYSNITSAGTPTSTKIATFSFWVKRTELQPSGNHLIFIADSNFTWVGFNDDGLYILGSTAGINLRSNGKFRDTSAWYHIVVAFDTTQSTASNRVKVYVNGEQWTEFGVSENYGTQNNDIDLYDTNTSHYLGWSDAQSQSGYYAEFYLIDGQQLAPTQFGEFDSDTGIWIPKAYTGSFGVQGYHLDFEDSSALGADVSGNGNNFTALYSISAADQATDTPTNNFMTLNPLDNNWANVPIINEGATNHHSDSANFEGSSGTIAMSSGKWYWEIKTMHSDGNVYFLGIGSTQYGEVPGTQSPHDVLNFAGLYLANSGTEGGLFVTDSTGGSVYRNAFNPGANHSANDIYGFALDLDSSTQTITFYRNGSNINPSSGAALDIAGACSILPVTVRLSIHEREAQCNFGGYTEFSISSAASDANGYGTFEYAPPSGYYAICTKNLAEYG